MKSSTKYRFEKKYLIDNDIACVLKQRMSYVLAPDTNGEGGMYYISSLYFDDQYNTSYYDKQNGVVTRDKYRVRFYNDDTSYLRLERKHKHGEMIYKENAVVTEEQFQMMCHGDYTFMSGEPVPVYEKFYAAHVTGRMRPVIMVSYDRQAYMHPAGNVRITFDSNITAGNHLSDFNFPVIPDDYLILEIKYSRFIPELITGLITGVQLTQQLALSKFAMSKMALQGVFV